MASEIIIIGAGPAGLGAAYYAHRAGMTFDLYEASGQSGGNARTLEMDGFRFDTGAHRWHDKIPDITADLTDLLGDNLRPVDTESAILEESGFRQFPLDPVDLLRGLGLPEVLRSLLSLIRARSRKVTSNPSFKDLALHRYGQRVADRFLLGYSEKLWGLSSNQLSPDISGSRLKGLDLRTLMKFGANGSKRRTRHLDGHFYYPRLGIGMIADAMVSTLPAESIHLDSPVEAIHHQDDTICSLQVGGHIIPVHPATRVVSTLPLNFFADRIEPPPPSAVRLASSSVKFRSLRLLTYGIARSSLSRFASIYFPGASTPFTRLYESTNRSREMAPAGTCSVALELPTNDGEQWWNASDESLMSEGRAFLQRHFNVHSTEILMEQAHKIAHAYPILRKGIELDVEQVTSYLGTMRNLHLLGRNQTFRYQHMHDLLAGAKELVHSFTA